MRTGLQLSDIGAAEFLALLDTLTGVYQAAMEPPAEQLPGRSSIMERHAGYPSFRAVVAAEPAARDAARRGDHIPRLAGFAYGFHGARGQWWHDLVREVVAHKDGATAAEEWFGDSFEIAEVHVHPGHQGHGMGRAMMRRLTEGQPERTAVLSTMDTLSRARRLYRGLGFTDLVAGFVFPGSDLPYAIMGAPLPLRTEQLRHETGCR
jgi:ribosomal protein S18 acetylase RimI-like enzyme